MGYYVSIQYCDFTIPPENLDEAYRALCALNDDDDAKRGGRWGPLPDGSHGQIQKWFSWMDADYPNVCKNAEEIFRMLGFETESTPDDGLFLTGYSSKTGQEDLFLEAAAPFVKPGSFIEWSGEEGEMWREEYDGHTRRVLQGRVVWEEG